LKDENLGENSMRWVAVASGLPGCVSLAPGRLPAERALLRHREKEYGNLEGAIAAY